ncbi:hypothetical protein FOE78_16745 [Microlunatus elymi]|uniref:AbiEi antitoxin C-terminal domain-containing protein n=1 Tax=Microlunatus elymi TaxID=2596828 RepID=A0A516Q1N7_9ACTN|nr:type IV toxin-antitoxin system AbiEi family antitoxin [Microlunatus elymi]QDP97349.1 hypothetical protein FOE78_16745 [Microlunatus elymi]
MNVARVAARAPMRTVRPKDLRDVTANPHATAGRLVAAGELLRLSHGYFVAVPDDAPVGWNPTIEAAALGIGAAVYGPQNAILMGVSAARVHHAIPRAIGAAVVAVPEQHRPVRLDRGGTVTFVKRDTDGLEAELMRLDTGRGLVTTPEQTVLDLVKRPDLGGVPEETQQAILNLASTIDLDAVATLARAQHAPAALARLRKIMAPA